MELEEIDGFKSPGEFARFKAFLEAGMKRGELKAIPPDPSYHAGEIYGGRWFEVACDKSVSRLISPDPPFRGVFEHVG